MAGKNSRLNKFMQMIGIVDVPQDEADDRGAYGRESDMDGYRERSRNDGYGRDNRYDSPYGYSEANYSARQQPPRYSSGAYRQGASSRTQQRTASFEDYAPRGNVTPMPPRGEYRQESFAGRQGGFEPQRASSGARSEGRQRTVIYAIRRLEDCQDVIIDLIEGKTMLINLEELHSEDQQRVVDTLSGASFALNAVLRKAADKIYLIAPSGVEINDIGSIDRRY